jgi:tRNA-specific 2-thiouridylase
MRIVVAMSGGVDSSVAAALLAEEGHEVIGLSMQLYDQREGEARFGSCCTIDDLHDARRVAAALDIPHYIVNFERQFEAEVISNFVGEYVAGRTPIPCVHCNGSLKFATLLSRALGLGAEAVATGHYARIERRDDRWRLLRAADAQKDQTYFLWMLTQDQLGATRFPLGEMTKPQVRALATELGLPTAQKPESQEICFVPFGDYRTLLQERRGYAGEEGAILDAAGTRVGTHSGYAHFTVGQRHGLGVALGEPVYVREVRPARNEIVVGRREEVFATKFLVDERHFIAGEAPHERFEASVRIRHKGGDVPCEVTLVGDRRMAIETAEPVWAPAPGQAAVLYAGEECLGGGRIIAA